MAHKELNNALVIDLEFWHNSEFLKDHIPEEWSDQFPESAMPVLELLEKYNTRATFAVLGMVAERRPELIKLIYDQGHEIASHGYSHRPLFEMSMDEFEQEIIKSIELLTSITGEKPIGYRAPSFSLDNSTKWMLDILERYGFKYDASVFPMRTNLYGVPNAPLYPYRPSKEDIAKESQDSSIIEFPMTVFRQGVNIPVGGGFYFRAWPYWLLHLAYRRIERTRPVIFYIHPWEMYHKTPRLNNISYFAKFVTYYGINKSMGKFERLLANFRFKPIRDVLHAMDLL